MLGALCSHLCLWNLLQEVDLILINVSVHRPHCSHKCKPNLMTQLCAHNALNIILIKDEVQYIFELLIDKRCLLPSVNIDVIIVVKKKKKSVTLIGCFSQTNTNTLMLSIFIHKITTTKIWLITYKVVLSFWDVVIITRYHRL
jgi:hypothetical protein